MKIIRILPLLFLTACSTAPKLVLRPQQAAMPVDNLRYPEIVRAYHFGRYVDPGDDLVMHDQHVVFRVEENTRWNLHPAAGNHAVCSNPLLNDVAFNPTPVNDEILAEVNSQRIATAGIMAESKILAAAIQQIQDALQGGKRNELATANLRMSMESLKKRVDALEATEPISSPFSTTNELPSSLNP